MDEFLSSVRVTQLWQSDATLISIDNQATIEQALKKIVSANIYCVPVIDSKSGKALGLVSQGNNKKTVDEFAQHSFSRAELDELHAQFLGQTAAKIMNCSGQNSFTTRPSDISLKDALKVLSEKNLRRIAIVDASGKVLRLLSQSAIIAFLAKNLDKIAERASVTIEQAQIGTRPLISIPSELRAIDAFVMMIEYRLSSLAYLGDAGHTTGNISVKDIKGMLLDHRKLVSPVIEYVNMIRNDSTKDFVPMINVHTTDTVSKAIAKLAAVGIHRVYLFGETNSPVGIVALVDILRFLQK